MTFEELGSALRSEREDRGLSIEDVAEHLKISPRLLRAIEDGNMEAFPHQAYARGFIRSYATYLGMGAQEINAAANLVEPSDAAIPESYVMPERGGGGFVWIALIVLLAAVAGGGYYAYDSGFLALPSVQPRRLAKPAPPEDVPPASDNEKKTDAKPIEPAGAITAKTTMGNALTADSGNRADQVVVNSEPIGIEGNKTENGISMNSDGQHKVIIIATEECWIHSNADKTDTRQFSLRKGDTFALTFIKSLDLKLGNAGGVRIRYDGKDMGAAGQSGQVRTMSFPPEKRP